MSLSSSLLCMFKVLLIELMSEFIPYVPLHRLKAASRTTAYFIHGFDAET